VRAFRAVRLAIAAGAVLVLAAGTFAGSGAARAASQTATGAAAANGPAPAQPIPGRTTGSGATANQSRLSRAAATSFTITGELNGVAAVSPSNVWAVGYSGLWPNEKILIVHWNGQRWTQIASPKPVYGDIFGIDAVSADDIWLVGCTSKAAGANERLLMLHWNGKQWSKPGGFPVISGQLDAVTVYHDDVWAVGATGGNGNYNPLVVRLTGGHWYFDPVPTPKGGLLWGVAATAAKSVWAFGDNHVNYTSTLVHWSGGVWGSVAFPMRGKGTRLLSIAAGPRGTAWAVGRYVVDNGPISSIALAWAGGAWHKTVIPAGATQSDLNAVCAIPGGEAWAVGWGYYPDASGLLALRWTGTSWVQVPTPAQTGTYGLFACSASSASNAWAVGTTGDSQTEIVHWNGKTWS